MFAAHDDSGYSRKRGFLLKTCGLSMNNSFLVASSILVVICAACSGVQGFSITHLASQRRVSPAAAQPPPPTTTSTTALNVWWFGGTESGEINQDGDSCELVAVRIERTSSNSRKIAGSITVPTPLSDVWAILSDYNRLAVHVPNLVESKILSQQSKGEPGDGSFRCKLFQKGAQKIVGFEFGASVTMQMTEQFLKAASSSDSSDTTFVPQERIIGFKCVDSFFFSEFDGEWRATEQLDQDGQPETVLNYVVDVRPKGPVPVAALEWRIREDVPTNLRAVKKAAMEVGQDGVLAFRNQQVSRRPSSAIRRPAAELPQAVPSNGVRRPQMETTNAIRRATVRRPTAGGGAKQPTPVVATRAVTNNNQFSRPTARLANGTKAPPNNGKETRARLPFKVIWEEDETMAAYLSE